MFRESIIVRQLFIGLLFSFLAAGGLRAEAFGAPHWPNQTWELASEGESAFYSSALAEQTLELQVHGAGILLLESAGFEEKNNGPTLVGALQSRGGAHWIRQQGTHLSLAFTRAGTHRLRVIQGGLPEALQGIFVPTPIRSRQLQMPTARGLLNVERMELLDPVDGSVWVGLLELRDPQGGSDAANVDLSWTSERRDTESAEGEFVDTAMVVTLRQAGMGSASKNGENDDPHPPDDEVDPYPSGFWAGQTTENSENDDPHPPDDEVDPYPSGFWAGQTAENSENDDPHPPDDEVDPYPSGFWAGQTAENSENDDPHPPDDEVDPYPSGFWAGQTAENSENDDPHPPDDEVDPYPSGFWAGQAGENSENDDPHPPDDEVDPYPSGFWAGQTAENSENDDPHPPDDEVDPYPSGFSGTNGVIVQQLRVQLRSARYVDTEEEALAVLAWLSQLLMPELEAQSPVDVEVRGFVH